MKVKSLIISLILIVCFAGIGIGLYCAWPAITGTITDSKYYTSEDLQEAYDKGYNDAFKNKDELTQQVDYYKELTDTYYISILDYQAQIKDYETLTENNKNTISILEQNKTELQSQVDNLTTIKNSNEETISNLQVEVISLENQVKILTTSDSSKTEEIAELNKQITSLNNLISQLQNTNTLNVNTIASLNSQIESLNSQISNMILQNQTASSQITALNNEISKLQESINYYEQYIASLENGEQVVATFEFDGSVYNIQILNKNSIVTVTTPTSTDYVIFNYWTVNGEQVDLSTYQITTNTKFVANVTYKYDVKFKVDNTDYDSQIVVKNGYATLPEEPTKAGYEFDGWSINGIDIVENISTTAVTQNVTYKAVFTQLHTVTFMSDGEIKSTQSVRNGEYATNVDIESTTYKVFNGWKIDSDIINISQYPIYSSVVFIADYTNKYDVKFMVDGQVYDSQIVEENAFATLPETPTKEGYIFEGWFFGGLVEIIIPEWKITQNITLTAKFTKLHTVDFVVDNDVVDTQLVKDGEKVTISQISIPEGFELVGWSDGSNIIDLTSYNIVEDITLTAKLSSDTLNAVVSKTWNNYSNINGEHVWTDGENIYYSSGSSNQYKLNKNTNTWESVSWTFDSTEENLFIVGSHVWTDGEDVYYSNNNRQFVLNKETMIWEKAPWGSYIYGNCVWSDGENIYYTTNAMEGKSLIFNRATKSWSSVEFKIENSNLTTIDVLGSEVWTDGENIYYSYGAGYQLKLDKSTRTWTYFDFNVVIAYGSNIWTYDNDIYYSFGATQYKLDKNNNKFVEIVWEGADSLRGDYIWTDGDKVYCSNSSTYQYQLINA